LKIRPRSCEDLFLLECLVPFYFHYFTAFVKAAAGADMVGQAHLAAIGASHKVARFERIVCPAAVPTAFGNFTFWQRGHV